MLSTHTYCAPNIGSVVAILVSQNEQVEMNQPLVIIEAMKMQTTLCSEVSGKVGQVFVTINDECFVGMPLVDVHSAGVHKTKTPEMPIIHNTNQKLLGELQSRAALTLDPQRLEQKKKRHKKGSLTERKN